MRGAWAAALPTSLEERDDGHLSPRPLPTSNAWASPLKQKCWTCSDKSFPHITDHWDVGRKEARPAAPRSDPAVGRYPVSVRLHTTGNCLHRRCPGNGQFPARGPGKQGLLTPGILGCFQCLWYQSCLPEPLAPATALPPGHFLRPGAQTWDCRVGSQPRPRLRVPSGCQHHGSPLPPGASPPPADMSPGSAAQCPPRAGLRCHPSRLCRSAVFRGENWGRGPADKRCLKFG